MTKTIFISLIFVVFGLSDGNDKNFKKLDPKVCSVNKKLKEEISKYAPIVKHIINSATNGKLRSKVINPLDKFPQKRVEDLKLADIGGIVKLAKKMNLENPHKVDFDHTSWHRYRNFAEMVKPIRKQVGVYTLLSTSRRFAIEAEVIVFDSLQEVDKKQKQIKGKIAVFNLNNRNPFADPNKAEVEFYKAMQFGAVAAFSACVKSLSTLHNINDTILLTKLKGRPKYKVIPSAYISVEDAMMLSAIQKRQERIFIYLRVLDSYVKTTNAESAVAEIVGSKSPEKIVVVTGMEFSELYVCWNVGAVLKGLNLKPKRTIRFVGWDAGYSSSFPLADFKNIDFEIISKNSTGAIQGLQFIGSREAACILNEIVKLLKPLGSINVYVRSEESAGKYLSLIGYNYIPTAEGIWSQPKKPKTANANDVDTAFWAVIAYVVADLSVDIPKNIVYFMKDK